MLGRRAVRRTLRDGIFPAPVSTAQPRPTMISPAEQLAPILSKSIIDLQKAFLRDGLEGYEPGDIYHTPPGRLAKKLWRKGTKLSFVVAAPQIGRASCRGRVEISV